MDTISDNDSAGKPRRKPDGCGCVWCDHGWPIFEGQHIQHDYHRAPNGERINCTRKS